MPLNISSRKPIMNKITINSTVAIAKIQGPDSI